MASCPLYEGDTILLSCFYAKGYVYSLPPSSSYSSISIYPQEQEEPPNVHTVAFQVLPEYAKIDLDSVSPLSITKEDERSYLRYKLVYGRKIKLLHVASKKYVFLPERAQNDNDTKPAFLDSQPYLFRILPAYNNNKTRGDTIMSGDEVKLESVLVKGHHILCVKNAFSGSFELKMAVTNSVFSIISQTACDCSLLPNIIRGGSVVRFGSIERDSYLCGAGSTVAHILPPDLEHDSQTKTYFKKKKPLPIPRPPPVAGDCWWQLMKCDNPLDGSSFKVGERCHIRHLLTQKYLATDPKQQVVTMASISEIKSSGYNHTFYLKDSNSDMTNDITKGCVVAIGDSEDDTNCKYLSFDDKSWEFAMSKAIGTKMFTIHMDSTLSDTSYLKIDEVKPDDLHKLYSLISAKIVLMNFLQKLQDGTDVVLDELTEVLDRLLNMLQNDSNVNLKKCVKMFRATHCADLLVSYLNLQLKDKDLTVLRDVCKVLEAFAQVKSPRSHWYLAKKSFLNIFFKKLGHGVGVENFLVALVEDESSIAQSLVDHFVSAPVFDEEIAWKSLDASGLKLLSTLCFIDGYPEESLQNIICQNVIDKKGKRLFYSTEQRNDQVYYYSPDSTVSNSLTGLCSHMNSPEERSFQFFVAQLSLFSRVCKGINRAAIKVVSQWFPFEQALCVLADQNIHSLAKSAYLEIVISVYLDGIIAESGVDIDSIWTCYLWERLAISTKPGKEWSCQPLEGSNVKQNLVKDLPHSKDIGKLLEIIKNEIAEDNVQRLFVKENYNYLSQLLAVLEPMIAFGFCWNVKGEETNFSIQSLVNILNDGKGMRSARDSPDGGIGGRETPGTARSSPWLDFGDIGREEVDEGGFMATTESLPMFQIKARTLRLLQLFFKQFIYLALEQFLYEFRSKKDGTSNDYLPAALFEEDITYHLTAVTSLHPSLFYQMSHRNLRKHFEFTDYRSFDIKKQEGQSLVRILQWLMRYDDDELRTSSAALLYDIYSKEQLLFTQAELSYIVDGKTDEETSVYHEMVSYGAFNDEFKIMKALLQGRALDIEDEAGVEDTLQFMVYALMVAEDETEINSSSQNIVFTTGVFASLLNYVLKFCVTHNVEQTPYLIVSCKVLQMVCRANPKIQQKIVESFSDFMKVKIAASSVARLLTEVFTNNEDICRDITNDNLIRLYKLAHAYSCKEGEEEKDIEHMEIFTTLEAVMMPGKLTGNSLRPAQGFIIKLFYEDHTTVFGQLFLPDDQDNTISTARRTILEKSEDNDVQLLKLLHVTSLIATCCNGPIKSAEDICRDIFTLEELVDIVTNTSISPIRKIPFARLLGGAYLGTERESISSLHLLAQNLEFWNHIHQFTAWIEPLAETLNGDEVKPYLRKISEYYQTWNETFSTEGDTATLFVLRYFIEGLGPLLTTFCNELASYKNKNLTKIEYGKIINPRGDTLRELGAALVGLITGKEKLMLANRSLTTFWQNCLESIEKVLPESPNYHILTQQYDTKDNFDSDEVKQHISDMESRTKINLLFQRFIANYKAVYEWTNPTSVKPPRDLRSCDGLMPQGVSFKKLINLFVIIVERIDDQEVDDEGCMVCEANVNSTCVLLDLLEVLYRQLHHPMSSKDKARLRNTLAVTLQVLFGIIYLRSEQIDDKYWQVSYGVEIKPLQTALASNKSKIGVNERCVELVLKHLLYHDDTVTVHILALLYTLVFNGNTTTQDIIYSLLLENTNFFLTLQRLISRIVFQFGGKIVTVEIEPPPSKQKAAAVMEQVGPLQRELHATEAHVPIEQLEHIQLLDMTPGVTNEETPPPAQKETILQLSEGDKEALNKVGVVLDLTSALCDGQNRKLQSLMREQQEDFSITSINILSGTAALLQTLAELPSTSKASPDNPLIVETITKSIQTLIEMCAGNYVNQQVALDGQVVDSINSILSNSRDAKDIDDLLMQCKSIELLQVLLEETDTNSTRVVQAISKDLKKEKVIQFIDDIYHMDIEDEENYSHIIRGMFQAYHIMRSLAETEKKSFSEYAELSQEAKSDSMWKVLNEETGHIEVNYITKEGKEILTQVYFPLEDSHLLTDDEKSTMQSDLVRDSLEDKMRDLLEWTESVWKNDQHKRILKKYYILQPLTFFSTMRHWLLIILTILLNIFVLGTYQIPSEYNCTVSEQQTISNTSMTDSSSSSNGSLLLIPRPWECWTSLQYIILYILGALHSVLAVWMVLEFYIREAPNFVFTIPFMTQALYNLRILVKESSGNLYRKLTSINDKIFFGFFKLDRPRDKQCFDTYFFGIYSIYRVLFVISSIAALSTYGYFYCLCLPYFFIKVDVILHVIKAVGGKAKQLIFVALLILTLLLIYAVLSFAIMSSFFNVDEQKFCRSLWECYVTVIREGLIDSFGGAIPVTYVGQSGSSFNIYLWRSIIDLSYFVVVSVVALEVITAILVDRFSEIRAERDAALKDQRDLCYVCGIASDVFEREGPKGRGFWEHYHEDHNVYNYIYYALYIRSMPVHDHNAIEKYVYDKMKAKSIDFYPLRKAKVLGGSVNSNAAELVDDIKTAIDKYEGQ